MHSGLFAYLVRENAVIEYVKCVIFLLTKEKPNWRRDCNDTNKTLGRGIPSSANIQGNSTPNPRVPGYPLNCIIFLNNLSERLVR